MIRKAFIALPLLSAFLAAAVPAMQSKLHAAVVVALKDPESAKFRGEFLSRPDDIGNTSTSLCGELNSKNGYGGYTGFHRFVINTDGMVVFEEAEPRGFDGVWLTWCSHP